MAAVTEKLSVVGAEWEDDVTLAAIKAITKAISVSSSDYMIATLDRLAGDKEIKAHVKDGIMDYLYVAGFLSFAGKEITRPRMEKVLRAVGITPDDKLITLLLRKGIKSHLMYVYSYYFLVAIGAMPTPEKMMAVVGALGRTPDRKRAGLVFKFCDGAGRHA